MGSNCVGGGGTPHLVILTLHNHLPINIKICKSFLCSSVNKNCGDNHIG